MITRRGPNVVRLDGFWFLPALPLVLVLGDACSFKAGRSPSKKSVWYISVNAPYPSPALLNPSVNKFYPQLNKLETFQFHLQVGNTVEYWFYVLLSNSVKSTAKLSWIEFAVLATNPACQPFNNYNQGCLIQYWKQLQWLYLDFTNQRLSWFTSSPHQSLATSGKFRLWDSFVTCLRF